MEGICQVYVQIYGVVDNLLEFMPDIVYSIISDFHMLIQLNIITTKPHIR